MTELSDDDIQKLFDKLVDAEVLPPDKMKELSGRFFAALEEKKREIAANPAVGEKIIREMDAVARTVKSHGDRAIRKRTDRGPGE